MIIYILLILMASAFAVLEMAYPDSKRLKRWMIVTSAFAMSFLAGLRFEVGGDWIPYLNYHRDALNTTFLTYVVQNDIGYMTLDWIFARAGLQIWSTNLVCAAILATGAALLASTLKYSNLFMLSAVPYLIIVVGMGYSRQSAAIGMVCIATYFMLNNRRAPALAFALLSLVFHKSAAFGILPVLLTFGKSPWVTFGMSIVGIPLLIYSIVLETMEYVQSHFLSGAFQSAGAYIRIAQIFLCGLWFFALLFKREPQNRQRFLKVLGVLAVLSMPALIVSPSDTLVDRLALYLLPFQCYVLARTPEIFMPGSNRTMAYAAMICVNLAIFVVWMTSADNLHNWLPYMNYLWSET